MLKAAASLILGVVVTAAVYVVVGMVGGANPQFSRGRSSTSSVLVQELAGALVLTALAVTAIGLVAVARGKVRNWPFLRLPAGLLLIIVWRFALLVERAS